MPFKDAVLIRASNCCLYKNTYVKIMYFSRYMSLVVRKPVFGVSHTNRSVQPQKMARGLKFRIYVVCRDRTIRTVKLKALTSCAVTVQLICVFVFAYAKSRFSHNKAHMKTVYIRWDHDMYLHTLPMTQTDVSLRS